jgi:folate-binding protein YgfZ
MPFNRTQYDAARSGTVWLERPARGRLWLAGADRLSYLQGLLTNDTRALGPGRGCYAAYLTPQGRMIADMRLFEMDDGLLMTVPVSMAARLRDRLDGLVFSEDVRIEDRTAALAQLGLHGPRAASTVEHALGAPGAVAPLAAFRHRRLPFGDTTVVVASTDELGGGLDLFVETPRAAALRDALGAAGAMAAGAGVAEVLRVEAGVPEYGVDMDEETIPLEAGIEARAISFTKGCYVGQEVIVRVLHRGQGRVARRLVGLTIGDVAPPASAVPAAGAPLRAESREVGRLTSAVRSPALNHVVALGYVHRDFAEPGTRLVVVHGGAALSAVVTRTPFVPAS